MTLPGVEAAQHGVAARAPAAPCRAATAAARGPRPSTASLPSAASSARRRPSTVRTTTRSPSTSGAASTSPLHAAPSSAACRWRHRARRRRRRWCRRPRARGRRPDRPTGRASVSAFQRVLPVAASSAATSPSRDAAYTVSAVAGEAERQAQLLAAAADAGRTRACWTASVGLMSTSSAGGSTSLSLLQAGQQQPAPRRRPASGAVSFGRAPRRRGARQRRPARRRRRGAAARRASARRTRGRCRASPLAARRAPTSYSWRAPAASPLAASTSPRMSWKSAANAPAFATSSSASASSCLPCSSSTRARRVCAIEPQFGSREPSATAAQALRGLVELARLDGGAREREVGLVGVRRRRAAARAGRSACCRRLVAALRRASRARRRRRPRRARPPAPCGCCQYCQPARAAPRPSATPPTIQSQFSLHQRRSCSSRSLSVRSSTSSTPSCRRRAGGPLLIQCLAAACDAVTRPVRAASSSSGTSRCPASSRSGFSAATPRASFVVAEDDRAAARRCGPRASAAT